MRSLEGQYLEEDRKWMRLRQRKLFRAVSFKVSTIDYDNHSDPNQVIYTC